MPRFGPTNERLEATASTTTSLLAELQAHQVTHAEEILSFGAAYVNFLRVKEDLPLQPGDVWRVHLRPRRFQIQGIDWAQRILKDTSQFISVNKPYGIPVHPTCDNLIENAKHQLQLHLKAPLWVTHRLDIQTAGVLVFAKTKAYANHLRRQFEERKMRKHYLASVQKPLACGTYSHYMNSRAQPPYECTEEERPGWKHAELEILSCEFKAMTQLYDLQILLKTGRHHQIRSQLRFLENPIVGDDLYGSSVQPAIPGTPLLTQTRLAFHEEGFEPFIYGSLE